MTGLGSTLATIWRLFTPYFRSEDRWAGRVLLAALVAIELSVVGIDVLINQWNARFFNALQAYDWPAYGREMLTFGALATAAITLGVYQNYLNQWLQIRWRQWMTSRYLSHWLDAANHYRMQLLGEAADNPDQRIAEDIHQFVDDTLFVGLSLINSIVSLTSFVVILWGLSRAAPLTTFGLSFDIPGYLVWAALLYATFGTLITHLVGRPLIDLNFNQQRYEADFRFNLVRVREHSEQIALLHGEPAEHQRLMDRFLAVVTNFRSIMLRTKTLNFFTLGYRQISIIFPFLVLAPPYFARAIPLGGLTQTAGAFGSMQNALSVFITIYLRLARWRAVIDRLTGFEASIANAQALAGNQPTVSVSAAEAAPGLHVDTLHVTLPTGEPLVAADAIKFTPGDHALVTGPSGSGKSTLFRAIGGIWPFGTGAIAVPKGARVMVLPQKPYFPVGSLAAAVSYPAVPGTFTPEQLREVLEAVDLPALAARLTAEAHWDRMLSPGEQQRLAVARAILQKPDFLFLDEATASLSEPGEAALYRLIHERLPNTTIISIGHRSTLHSFHQRHLALDQHGDRQHLRERDLAPAQ